MDLAGVSTQPPSSVSEALQQADDEGDIHRQPSVDGLQSGCQLLLLINSCKAKAILTLITFDWSKMLLFHV